MRTNPIAQSATTSLCNFFIEFLIVANREQIRYAGTNAMPSHQIGTNAMNIIRIDRPSGITEFYTEKHIGGSLCYCSEICKTAVADAYQIEFASMAEAAFKKEEQRIG
jgi:hypothetical protein